MFKDQYPATWRLAVARLEAHKKKALASEASDSKTAPSSSAMAHGNPLHLSIAMPIDRPGEIAVRLVRSGSTLTATVSFGTASDGMVEAAP
ncbi:hypothetical protein AB6806_18775 [Bosea sp. RCC_152_1]|uniref:hypothetical protein n=1 Tax=Bosea sp. RCC_152_1 TaxID=3239228 RepID=UPI003525062A